MTDKDKANNVKHVTKCRKKNRDIVLVHNGAKCQRCGYDKCPSALEFHHIDPDTKKFGIRDGQTRALKKMLEEADKCVLLCANCHRELHYGVWNIDEIDPARHPFPELIAASHVAPAVKSFCKDCGKRVAVKAIRCKECSFKYREKIDWPETEEILNDIRNGISFRAMGRKLGVSDNAVRKRLKNHKTRACS